MLSPGITWGWPAITPGEAEEAARAYQRALQYDRDLTEAHYNLGCLWLEQNKLEGARLELMACTLRRASWVEGQSQTGRRPIAVARPERRGKEFQRGLAAESAERGGPERAGAGSGAARAPRRCGGLFCQRPQGPAAVWSRPC